MSEQDELQKKAALWDSVEPVLRNWLFLRDSLSSDCQSLGISSSSTDSGKWGYELSKRCQRLRDWCSKHFYLTRDPKSDSSTMLYRMMKRAEHRRMVNDAVNLLCRTAIDQLPSGYTLSLTVSRYVGCPDGEANIKLECDAGDGNVVEVNTDTCEWLDAIDAAIDSNNRKWLNNEDDKA